MIMTKIILNISDERKVDTLLSFICDLPYIEVQTDHIPKKWKGQLSALDNPVHVSEFRVFTREELHER